MPVTVKVNGVANSLVHKGSNGISMATIPDVCKTPSPAGPVPIPYPNISQSITLDKGTTTVKADGGMMIANKGSEFSLSNGDNAGVAGGVKSSTFMKESTWILYSFDVKMDGKSACRLSDKKFQNHENTADLSGVLVKPTAIVHSDPAANTIVCKSGQLVVQNNNLGIDRGCTEAHESSHANDWKDRYGEDLCKGVPDGKLPLGGPDYAEFLRQSEIKAYKVGLACRRELLKTANAAQKADIEKAIRRDLAMLKKFGGAP